MRRKKEALYQLAQKRREDKTWDGYYSIADFHNGIYECDYVSPNTKSGGNLNATVFVMMHDWSSTDSLNKPICQDSVKYGHTLNKGSNVNLKKLLQEHLGLQLSKTYATNLFPFIKPGPMNAHIPHPIMERAAIEYGLPQIRIIKPKLVICFGVSTLMHYGLPLVSARLRPSMRGLINLSCLKTSNFGYKLTQLSKRKTRELRMASTESSRTGEKWPADFQSSTCQIVGSLERIKEARSAGGISIAHSASCGYQGPSEKKPAKAGGMIGDPPRAMKLCRPAGARFGLFISFPQLALWAIDIPSASPTGRPFQPDR